MNEDGLNQLLANPHAAAWRKRLGSWLESGRVQLTITIIIVLNAVVLGLETSSSIMAQFGPSLILIDKACLVVFVIEIALKFVAYRRNFWRSPWNVFDFVVVGIALLPGTGTWSVLRALRVLRVLRLLTVVPALRKVVAAFLHSIPGLAGVVGVMSIFFYTAGVLATKLFGTAFPDWFGTLGRSLFSLFQIMTLESWSMGIVRPVMVEFPWAWAFFVPFIMIATFTILNLFIGIIVSTMQELSMKPDIVFPPSPALDLLNSIEKDVASLREELARLKR